MSFLVISNAPILKKDQKFVAYAPYVYEMDLWFDKVEEISVLCPTSYSKKLLVHPFKKQNLNIVEAPSLDFTSLLKIISSLIRLPKLFYKLFINISKAEHIHLRCPGNLALLGCLVQIFYPSKPKTVKYAGNWDPESKQPLSYKVQKWIVSNTFLTKNCKVLVYGEWKNQSKNIVPFFTASYQKKNIIKIEEKDFSKKIKLIFVGAFATGKRPLLSINVLQELVKRGFKNIQLDMFGDGNQFQDCKQYIENEKLNEYVFLHGNQPKEVVKKAFQEAHFLIFISKSEGWPKVVAEAMFWRCLPISSKVSCVAYMLDHGKRGVLVNANDDFLEIANKVVELLENTKVYQQKAIAAQNWSQQFTLDKFKAEIEKILKK